MKTGDLMPALLAVIVSASAAAAATAALPGPVQAFVARRAQCQHWAGEEPYDAARRAQIDRAVRRLRCRRLAHDEAVLRRRFRSNPEVIREIDRGPNPL